MSSTSTSLDGQALLSALLAAKTPGTAEARPADLDWLWSRGGRDGKRVLTALCQALDRDRAAKAVLDRHEAQAWLKARENGATVLEGELLEEALKACSSRNEDSSEPLSALQRRRDVLEERAEAWRACQPASQMTRQVKALNERMASASAGMGLASHHELRREQEGVVKENGRTGEVARDAAEAVSSLCDSLASADVK